jgi:hypothetical protein
LLKIHKKSNKKLSSWYYDMVHEVSPGPMGLDSFLIFQKILSNVPDMAPEPFPPVNFPKHQHHAPTIKHLGAKGTPDTSHCHARRGQMQLISTMSLKTEPAILKMSSTAGHT